MATKYLHFLTIDTDTVKLSLDLSSGSAGSSKSSSIGHRVDECTCTMYVHVQCMYVCSVFSTNCMHIAC